LRWVFRGDVGVLEVCQGTCHEHIKSIDENY
jgi:hypothetical protein